MISISTFNIWSRYPLSIWGSMINLFSFFIPPGYDYHAGYQIKIKLICRLTTGRLLRTWKNQLIFKINFKCIFFHVTLFCWGIKGGGINAFSVRYHNCSFLWRNFMWPFMPRIKRMSGIQRYSSNLYQMIDGRKLREFISKMLFKFTNNWRIYIHI